MTATNNGERTDPFVAEAEVDLGFFAPYNLLLAPNPPVTNQPFFIHLATMADTGATMNATSQTPRRAQLHHRKKPPP